MGSAMDPHAAEAEAKEKRRRFFSDLLAATHDQQSSTAASGTFATSGLINVRTVPDSLTVQGVGALRLPLSAADVAKLRNVCEQALHGHGGNTVLNTAIRRAWQVDAAKVSFPTKPEFLTKTLQEVAGTAVRALGVDCPVSFDNPEVEARLYKLLLYETGGHFKPHCITKEVGLFATLIVQLPTERGFKGGALVVEHGPGAMTFDYSKQSATGFFYTSFLADCQHTLQPITAGARLCLSFNLVRRTTKQIGAHQILPDCPRVRKVEDVLQPWLEATEALEEASNQSSTFFPTKFAIPLQHEYTAMGLGFAGLKGEDMVLAKVLRCCFDRRLALHLCFGSKTEYGLPNAMEPPPCRLFRKAWAGEQDPRFIMEYVMDETLETYTWVSIGDHRMPVYPELALDTEVVLGNDQPGLFADPDQFRYRGYFGNEGPNLDFFHHRAMLVVWPKSKIVETLAHPAHSSYESFHGYGVSHHEEAGLLSLLNMVEAMHEERDPHVRLLLDQVLAHCERDRVRIWQLRADIRRRLVKFSNHSRNKSSAQSTSGAYDVSSRLLDVCLAVGGLADVLRVLKIFGERYTVQFRCEPPQTETMIIGMRTGFVTKSIAAAVHTYGWAACGDLVLQLLPKSCLVEVMQFKPHKAPEPPIEGEYCLQLVVELQRVQCREAALIVAEKTFKLIYATVTRPGKFPAAIINAVVNMLVASSWDCLAGLAKSLLQQAGVYNQQHLLKKVLQSNHLWNEWIVRPHGRDALRALIEGRLAWIDARSEKPVLSWCQPLAQFPDHPSIEAFLRGPQPKLTYHNLCSLPDARKLASWFDGFYADGYCAIGTEGGRGAGAYCVIEKCPEAFTHIVRKWEKARKEAEGLRRKFIQGWRDRPIQRAPKRVRAEANINVQ